MRKFLLVLVLVFLFGAGSIRAAVAGPMLKLSPSSGDHENGSTFDVVLQVDSETVKSIGVDAWFTFDANRLEVMSVEKAASPAFDFVMGPTIHNSDGKLDINFSASAGIVLEDATAIKGDLAVIKFKAKNTGTAAVNFVCQPGSSLDTNIVDNTGADVVDCASNQNGSYTITEGGSNPQPTSPPGATATPQPTVTPAGGGELPRTGNVGTTVGLLIFGIVGVIAGTILKWL